MTLLTAVRVFPKLCDEPEKEIITQKILWVGFCGVGFGVFFWPETVLLHCVDPNVIWLRERHNTYPGRYLPLGGIPSLDIMLTELDNF